MARNKIVWGPVAREQFITLLQHINESSEQNTENVRNGIEKKLNIAAQYPESNPPDKYKVNNDASFRAFILFRYRISYRLKNDELRVLRIRHTSMKPKYY